ncbi:MAG: YidC/Oxa1 family membrane protein insertase [bacterium]|nr:YidC/Oxa1 family membrane protein insertase [bacterium]MDZ4299583.1 YidC/Oxa1 family membrane protein insertase [Candidatus Sungbacteria bacterium]
MNFFLQLYTEILWRPIFNALIGLYTILPGQDLGVAIIALTIAIRLLLLPLFHHTQKSQRELSRIQPKIKEIQAAHKNNKEAQSKALMELYAAERVNPFSGCLGALVQLPLLIALFQVFQSGFDMGHTQYLYSFIPQPGAIKTVSFGLIDLSHGNLVLGTLAAITQYFQARAALASSASSAPQNSFTKSLNWQMLYLFPILILLWSYNLPSALTLYWTAANVFAIVQERILRLFAKSFAKLCRSSLKEHGT